jgi:hypothetical protein
MTVPYNHPKQTSSSFFSPAAEEENRVDFSFCQFSINIVSKQVYVSINISLIVVF